MFDRSLSTVAAVDPEIWTAIQHENRRQEDHIELIASENYASPAVMAAQGSQLTNKYAEGYPGKRYYGGCEYVDIVEQLAIDRLKQLFGAEHANVQPNSGSQANQAVLFGLLQPGDTIMGMSLAEGGHLTHGMPLNMSGKWFKVVSYGLTAAEEIDYDAMERLAHEHKPQADHRRRLGLQPAHRLRALREGGEGGRRLLHGRHGALRRADRRGRLPEPGSVRGRRHLDHPQEPARAARRHHPDEGRRRQGDQQRDLPGHPGWPADARDRGQGGRLQGGPCAGIQGLPAAGGRQRRGSRRHAIRARAAHRQRPHREPRDAGRSAPEGPDRQGSRERARRRAHDLQQERHPERPAEADGDERHPARHAGDDDARLRQRRDPADREPDCRRAGAAA